MMDSALLAQRQPRKIIFDEPIVLLPDDEFRGSLITNISDKLAENDPHTEFRISAADIANQFLQRVIPKKFSTINPALYEKFDIIRLRLTYKDAALKSTALQDQDIVIRTKDEGIFFATFLETQAILFQLQGTEVILKPTEFRHFLNLFNYEFNFTQFLNSCSELADDLYFIAQQLVQDKALQIEPKLNQEKILSQFDSVKQNFPGYVINQDLAIIDRIIFVYLYEPSVNFDGQGGYTARPKNSMPLLCGQESRLVLSVYHENSRDVQNTVSYVTRHNQEFLYRMNSRVKSLGFVPIQRNQNDPIIDYTYSQAPDQAVSSFQTYDITIPTFLITNAKKIEIFLIRALVERNSNTFSLPSQDFLQKLKLTKFSYENPYNHSPCLVIHLAIDLNEEEIILTYPAREIPDATTFFRYLNRDVCALQLLKFKPLAIRSASFSRDEITFQFLENDRVIVQGLTSCWFEAKNAFDLQELYRLRRQGALELKEKFSSDQLSFFQIETIPYDRELKITPLSKHIFLEIFPGAEPTSSRRLEFSR